MADLLTLPARPAIRPTRNRASVHKALSNLLDIQRQLLTSINDPETPAQAKASCARAWTDCEERIRILRGKPLPGALKPVAKQPKQRPDAVIMGD
jgi:hypothetical protein